MIRNCFTNLNKTKHLSLIQRHIENTTQLFKLNLSSLHSSPSQNFDEPFEIIDDDLEIHTSPSRPLLVKQIIRELNCTIAEAQQISTLQKTYNPPFTFKKISSIAAFLKSKDVPLSSILENSWLFAANLRTLITKFEYIERLHPRNINDLLPLAKISSLKLNKIVKTARRESSFIPGGNRIYFLADKLNIDPYIISKLVSSRYFMLEMAYESLVENLNIFLEYQVKPEHILRDLWAFRYAPNSIRLRMERVRKAEKDKVMPWMVRCTEPVLAKSLQHAIDSKALLGENDSVLDYLSKRLGYSIETTRFIAMKHPAVLKVRVTKLKEVLDYFLNETDFDSHHIAMVPRILCHSLETTKKRLDELKSIGCVPTSLVVVCRSKKEYQIFVDEWTSIRNKIIKQSGELTAE